MSSQTVPARVDERFRGGMAADRRDRRAATSSAAWRRTVEGEVRFDAGTKALYATDASNFRQVPIGVVVPKTLDDIVATHRACREFGAPVLARGGGTRLSGETVNFAVVIDVSKYLTGIDDDRRRTQTIVAQPGAINEHVNEKAGEQVGMVFGPDPVDALAIARSAATSATTPAASTRCRRSCTAPARARPTTSRRSRSSPTAATASGSASARRTSWRRSSPPAAAKGHIYAQLRDLRDRYADVIRARYTAASDLPRRVSGYNLDELLPERGFNVARALVGTEGTCATALQAELKLTPGLYDRTLVLVWYDGLAEAAEHVMEIIELRSRSGWRRWTTS